MHGVVSHSLQNLVQWCLIFVGSNYKMCHPSGTLNSEVAQ